MKVQVRWTNTKQSGKERLEEVRQNTKEDKLELDGRN